jgi:hypothetical protein
MTRFFPRDAQFPLDDPLEADLDIERRDPQCNRCGSVNVRWRQQGGRWVLFSSRPGEVHVCEINADEFGKVEE